MWETVLRWAGAQETFDVLEEPWLVVVTNRVDLRKVSSGLSEGVLDDNIQCLG